MAYKNFESGIYRIINITNNKSYIGSAVNLRARWNCHKTRLAQGIHHSLYLQNAWNKYGKDNFIHEVLFTCSKENLIRLEQYHINNYKPEYNIAALAGSCLGVKRSPERKLQISESLKGRICSEETRKKISDSNKGKTCSAEIRAKISEIQTKQKLLDPLGYRLRSTKLSVADIIDIKQMLKDKQPMTACMKKYNISRTPVYMIKTGKSWTDIKI